MLQFVRQIAQLAQGHFQILGVFAQLLEKFFALFGVFRYDDGTFLKVLAQSRPELDHRVGFSSGSVCWCSLRLPGSDQKRSGAAFYNCPPDRFNQAIIEGVEDLHRTTQLTVAPLHRSLLQQLIDIQPLRHALESRMDRDPVRLHPGFSAHLHDHLANVEPLLNPAATRLRSEPDHLVQKLVQVRPLLLPDQVQADAPGDQQPIAPVHHVQNFFERIFWIGVIGNVAIQFF